MAHPRYAFAVASARTTVMSLGCFSTAVLLLMVWLGYWLVVIEAGPDDASEYPSWYLDPLDSSWQISLTPNDDTGLGARASRPIRVCGAVGEQTYLASLTCAAGTPAFDSPFAAAEAKREAVASPLGVRFVDRFEVTCPAGKVDLFVSPYHCGENRTTQAPAGFSPRF